MSDKQRVAVVTGILGQTGSYMAELLLREGYLVYGFCRPRAGGLITENISLIKNHKDLKLLEADICDHINTASLISELKPDLFFNFAAQSNVGTSFKIPVETFRINAEATIAQLDAIKSFSSKTKYYFAATSEMFGGLDCPENGYSEKSLLSPRSPYAIAKVAAYHAVINYRVSYNLFACSGMLFNHESPRRGETFATRKITKGVAKIKLGLENRLSMGNMEAIRDFGHAKDYCNAIYLMMMQPYPDDYVIATGESISIKQALEYVCSLANLKYEDVYAMNQEFMRPSDVPFLKGDSSKARAVLGWKPEYDWKTLLKEMYESDFQALVRSGGK